MKDPSTRRTALKVGGSALCGVFAGCTGFRESRQPVRIDYPKVRNYTEQALDVDIHVLNEGETVYWKRVQATAAEREARRLGGASLEGFPEEAGKYVIYAQLPFVEQDGIDRKDLAVLASRHSVDCIVVSLTIDMWQTDGVEHPMLGIAHAINC